jgi:hypothetical protein
LVTPREDFILFNLKPKRKLVMKKYFEELTTEDLIFIGESLDSFGGIYSRIVEHSKYKYGFTIRVSIVFFQVKANKWMLIELKKLLGYGLILQRDNRYVEYVIAGADAVENLLLLIRPYVTIYLHKPVLLKILDIIKRKRKILNKMDFWDLCISVDEVCYLTFGKRQRINAAYVNANWKDKIPLETLQK